MAYGTHYSFRFDSPNGTEFTIRLLENGYEGPVLNRSLGQSPVLKRERNGRICGSSLEIYAECLEDEEFAQLYTTSPFQWKAELELSDGVGGSVIWTGYVVPELYSEPDIAPPYDVQIIATDNLGELKFYNFNEITIDSSMHVSDILALILSLTQMDVLSDGRALSSMFIRDNLANRYQFPPVSWKWSDIAQRYDADSTCYDVLQDILTMLCADIYLGNDRRWWLVRDIDCGLSATGRLTYLSDWSGQSVEPSTDDVIQLGASSEWWPVNSLTSQVEPAHKRVQVGETPLYKESLLADPDMQAEYPNDYWHVAGTAKPYVLDDDSGYILGRYSRSISGAKVEMGRLISYPVRIGSTLGKKLKLSVTARNYVALYDDPEALTTEMCKTDDRWVYMYVILTGDNGQTYYLKKGSDGTPEGEIYIWQRDATRIELQMPEGEVNRQKYPISQKSQQLVTFELPITGNTPEGVVAVEFINKYGEDPSWDAKIGGPIFVSSCALTVDDSARVKGSVCTVDILNDARTSDEPIQIKAQTGVNLDSTYRADVMFTSTGAAVDTVGCQVYEASRILEFVAMDRAYCVALPRLRMRGTLNVPKGKYMPLIIERRGVLYRLEEYTWSLYDDEVDIDALSLPSVDIAIDDLIVTTKEE